MISSLHRFRDITTFTVYVTACDHEKSFEFQQDTRNYRSHALSDSRVNTSQLIRTIFPKVWGLEKFQTAKVTFKVTQGHCCRRHSIGHMIFYYSSIVAISLSCTNSEILSLISPKLSRSRDLEYIPFRGRYFMHALVLDNPISVCAQKLKCTATPISMI